MEIPSAMMSKSHRSSSVAFRLPALETGWQGHPNDKMPPAMNGAKSPHGKVVTSVKIGASSKYPFSIFATKLAMTNASLSQ
jgi:hypothetical protein